jgi:hypothetical protein
MVKESDDASSIAFTPRGCDTWVDIPISMIDRAEHVGHRRCDDHAHPVFRIALKEAKDKQAKVLSALLAAAPAPEARGRPGAVRPPMRAGQMARRRPPRGWGGGGFDFGLSEESCEQICEQVYAACFRSTEGMAFDDWVTLCAFEYGLCMAGCGLL